MACLSAVDDKVVDKYEPFNLGKDCRSFSNMFLDGLERV